MKPNKANGPNLSSIESSAYKQNKRKLRIFIFQILKELKNIFSSSISPNAIVLILNVHTKNLTKCGNAIKYKVYYWNFTRSVWTFSEQVLK